MQAGLEGTRATAGTVQPIKERKEQGRDEVRLLQSYPKESGLHQGDGPVSPGVRAWGKASQDLGAEFPKCLEFPRSVPRWGRWLSGPGKGIREDTEEQVVGSPRCVRATFSQGAPCAQSG